MSIFNTESTAVTTTKVVTQIIPETAIKVATQPVKIELQQTKIQQHDLTDDMQSYNVQGLTSIAAVIDNRANEVGIALFTPYLSKVTTTQLIDNSLYTQTLRFLHLFEVKTVIISQSLIGTPLYLVLTSNRESLDMKLLVLARSLFSE